MLKQVQHDSVDYVNGNLIQNPFYIIRDAETSAARQKRIEITEEKADKLIDSNKGTYYTKRTVSGFLENE